MAMKAAVPFDAKALLAKVGDGRSIDKYRKNEIVFTQGDPADAVFYVQKGKVKITVVSQQGKEAVVAILGADDFFGEGCLAGQPRRMATVKAMVESAIMRLEKAAIVSLIHEEPAFSEMFIAHLLAPHNSCRRGPRRPVVQFQREATGTTAAAARELRQGGQA